MSGCGAFCRQLRALLWKNCLVKRRACCSTASEILLPVAVMLLLWAIRNLVSKTDAGPSMHLEGAIHYNGVPSCPSFWNVPGFGAGSQVVFVPAPAVNPIVSAFVATYANSTDSNGMPCNILSRVRTFPDETTLENYWTDGNYGIEYNDGIDRNYSLAAVVFNKIGSAASPQWSYTIRLNSTATRDANNNNANYQSAPDTSKISAVNTFQTVYDETYINMFHTTGQIFLQNFVENYIISTTAGVQTSHRQFQQVPFPTLAYTSDQFVNFVSNLLGFLFTIIYIWPVTRLIKGIVEEKETRIKEGMKMMGLGESVLWSSWVITYALMFLITAILITLVTSPAVFSNSNKGMIFFFFWMFSLTVISFCYFISVFFDKATVASTIGAVVFFISFFPYYAVNDTTTSAGAKMLASLSPPIAFALGSVVIANYESAGTGVNNLNASVENGNFSYNECIGMLVIDFILYTLLSVYFSRVMPSEWGTAERWYFCFMPSFWCPPSPVPDSNRAPSIDGVRHVELREKEVSEDHIEAVSPDVRQHLGVSIRGLRKTFTTPDSDEERVAVKSLNLDLYKGQILALLGHNGAGKTTTINMLSGMMPATSGDATVFGLSINNQMAAIRNILGVCPQHNILFPELTVAEHLELFCMIKGVPSSEITAKVHEMIEQVGLAEKINVPSAALSGGMQRKLSVGIALIGGSKIIFLDEPTSGMDPYSRRATWDLLKKAKNEVDANGNPVRLMILTTHFMDEADQLGDRIAIMAKGEIKCAGSSLFLKSKYGVGYTMTITKKDTFDALAVPRIVHTHVPGAELLSNVAGEISFRLPIRASPSFVAMFEEFDAKQEELGIDAYGVSVTTLEEVFLRVGRDEEVSPSARQDSKLDIQRRKSRLTQAQIQADSEPKIDLKISNANDDDSKEAASSSSSGESASLSAPSAPKSKSRDDADMDVLGSLKHNEDPFAMYVRHFRALFIKRWQGAKRDRRVWTWTILYPIIIMLFIGLLLLVKNTKPNVLLGVSQYNQPAPTPLTSNAAGLFAASGYPGASALDKYTVSPASLAYTQDQFLAYLKQVLSTFKTPPPLASVATNATFQVVAFSNYLLQSRINAYDPDDVLDPHMRLSRYLGYDWIRLNSNNTAVLTDAATLYHNTSSVYSYPNSLNLLNEVILQQLTGNPQAQIQLNIHPMPNTAQQSTLINTVAALIVSVAFASIPAIFVGYAVKEEEVKIKHQQFISGVSILAYWTSSFLWDYLNFLIPGFAAMIVFAIYSVSPLIGANSGATILGILLYGLSITPFSYCCSFLFDNSASARNTMLIVFIFLGALLTIASSILDIVPSTQNTNKSLKFIYRLFPSFCFGELISNEISRSSPLLFGQPLGLWDMNISGYPLVYMFWESIFYFLLVLVIEKVRSTPEILSLIGDTSIPYRQFEDEDKAVVAEKARLQNAPPPDMSGNREIISIRGLRKVYPARLGQAPKVAVHDLWLGIQEGQCYGYLGINGAGKTTTLKMLTADIIPTAGTAYLNGLDITSQQTQIRRLLGYCPQFDALIDELTAREHLFLFARIKGVDEAKIPKYVDLLIQKIGLQDGIADNPSKGYSGGNKRKLCVGIALIGNPPIVFLDEPSTGMDPGSRRFMWDLIASTMTGRSVILTTHSMEECEALCQNIGIMVGGRLRCSGSSQHLKHVYGSGYQVDAHVGGPDLGNAFAKFLEENFQGAQLVEKHGDNVKYRLPRDNNGTKVTIALIFKTIEGNKERFGISDYSVSETTLEQIFIYFAKQQEEETGVVAGLQ